MFESAGFPSLTGVKEKKIFLSDILKKISRKPRLGLLITVGFRKGHVTSLKSREPLLLAASWTLILAVPGDISNVNHL